MYVAHAEKIFFNDTETMFLKLLYANSDTICINSIFTVYVCLRLMYRNSKNVERKYHI